MKPSITRKDLIFACILVISSFILTYKLLTPVPLVISIDGATISSENLPKFFTFTDVVVIAIFSILLGFSISSLLTQAELGKPASEIVLEDRKKRWEEIARTLKEDEAKIYKIILEAGGIIQQSELVEKTGMSKATVSRTLDLLESKGLVERRRRGMGNIVLLK
jgi:uncharacterized membrane protein